MLFNNNLNGNTIMARDPFSRGQSWPRCLSLQAGPNYNILQLYVGWGGLYACGLCYGGLWKQFLDFKMHWIFRIFWGALFPLPYNIRGYVWISEFFILRNNSLIPKMDSSSTDLNTLVGLSSSFADGFTNKEKKVSYCSLC